MGRGGDVVFHRSSDKPYGPFSNFHPSKLIMGGVLFDSAEHAFQAMKFTPTGSGLVYAAKTNVSGDSNSAADVHADEVEFVFDPATMDNSAVRSVRDAATPADARAMGRLPPETESESTGSGDKGESNANSTTSRALVESSLTPTSAGDAVSTAAASTVVEGAQGPTFRADWDDIRLAVMYSVLRAKFAADGPDPKKDTLRELLLSTGGRRIVEQTSERDLFWGDGNGAGQNHLGKLLMKLRSELRSGHSIVSSSGAGADAATVDASATSANKGRRRKGRAGPKAATSQVGAGKSSSESSVNNTYDFYVVLDFEATCERSERIDDQEVIEFPSVLIDAHRKEVVDSIQLYIKPQRRPKLSQFCTELTGITQSQVEQGTVFADGLQKYIEWLRSHGLADNSAQQPGHTAAAADAANAEQQADREQSLRFCFITCGDWDLRTMLPKQLTLCDERNAEVAALAATVPEFQEWCNLKREFGRFFKKDRAQGSLPGGKPGSRALLPGMAEMLRELGLPLQGRHHSGIDDCRNIARVALDMIQRGCIIRPNGRLR